MANHMPKAFTTFDSLQPLFHTPLTSKIADPALFPEVLDYSWKNGKFFTLHTWSLALTAI
jgi:hypothetical protein